MDNRAGQKDVSVDLSDYDFDNARPATATEEFFVGLAEDAIKRTTPYLNEFLQKLITLNVAIIGASLVAVKERIIGAAFGLPAILFVFVSLGVAIIGVWPRQHILSMYCAASIEEAERTAIQRKSKFIRAALVMLLISIAMLILGFVFGQDKASQ